MLSLNPVRSKDMAELFVIGITALLWISCHSPIKSQEYFFEASADDRALRPIYSTALYTVYFDDALKRCVVHSGHTWGESGGGGGGTGIGIEAFRCDPRRVAARARDLGLKTYGNFSVIQPPPSAVSAPAPLGGVSQPPYPSQSPTSGQPPVPPPSYTPQPVAPKPPPPPPSGASGTTSPPAPAREPALGAPIPSIRPTIPGSTTEGNK